MLPLYSSKGAMVGIATGGAAHNVPCPVVVNAGQVLIAHLMYESTTITPSTPAGWTLLSGPHTIGTTARTWVYGKIAVGNEDGTNVNFGSPTGNHNRYGVIYAFDNPRNDTIANIVGGFNFDTGSSAEIPDVEVITPEADCLAINLLGGQDDVTIGPYTGETGGDWVEAAPEDLHSTFTPDQFMQIQTAAMSSAGTINGGSVTASGSSIWGVVGFYIRGILSAATETDNFFSFI